MSFPRVQPLLLPTLRLVADGHSVEEIRERLKEQFKIVGIRAEQRGFPTSGRNIFVNRVAWALAHLVMGKLIELNHAGLYRITEQGKSVLKGNPSELTIRDLH
jgi:restriction system protein